MPEVASQSAGGRVVIVSSLDVEHPPENIIDGTLNTCWISTGLYPQEILVALGCRAAVSGVQLASTGVKRVRIECSQEEVPVNFQTLAEGDFSDAHGQMQLERINCAEQSGGQTAYVRVVILSGWHDFCTVHQLRVEGTPSGEPAPRAAAALGGEARARGASAPEAAEAAAAAAAPTAGGRRSSPEGSAPSRPGPPPLATESPVAESPDPAPTPAAAAGALALRDDSLQAQWLEQVKRDGMSLRFLPQDLRSDRELVLAAVRKCGDALQFANELFRADRELAVAAVRGKGTAIRWASEALRGDKRVALAAVYQSGNALQFCSRPLRADLEVVLAAVGQHGSALRWACPQLRANEEVIDVASRTYFFTRQELADFAEDDEQDECRDDESDHSDN